MTRYEDEVAAVAEAYRTARELMGSETAALELARQCYDDLWLGHPSDQVGREIEQIVLPPDIPLKAVRLWLCDDMPSHDRVPRTSYCGVISPDPVWLGQRDGLC